MMIVKDAVYIQVLLYQVPTIYQEHNMYQEHTKYQVPTPLFMLKFLYSVEKECIN